MSHKYSFGLIFATCLINIFNLILLNIYNGMQTVKEYADNQGFSVQYVYKLIHEGKLKFQKVGSVYLIKSKKVEAWVV